MGVVCVGGSRSLSGEGLLVAARVGSVLAARGSCLAVGCARGADAAVLGAFVSVGGASRAVVFAVGGPSGAGFLPPVVPVWVSAALAAGASVRWFAGGPVSVPGVLRLSARSRAAVLSAGSAVFVVGSPSSRGSFGAARAAAGAGLPVFVLPVGFPGAALPSLARGGSWVLSAPASALFGASCFRWLPR